MSYELKNKVVLITGAAAGIGALVVRMLVESEDVKHVTILDVDDAGVTLEKELNSKYGSGKVSFIKCDITNDEQLFGAYKAVTDKYGYIDVVINNAGIMNDSYKMYKKMVEVNVTALYTSTLKALELMRKDEGGRGGTIINISSIAALIKYHITPLYYGTKSAVLHFSNCLGLDEYYTRTGVRVIAICFGVTNTTLLAKQKIGNFDKYVDSQLLEILNNIPAQQPESAARALIEAYKHGESGSTWLSMHNKPAEDISGRIKKAYDILSEGILSDASVKRY